MLKRKLSIWNVLWSVSDAFWWFSWLPGFHLYSLLMQCGLLVGKALCCISALFRYSVTLRYSDRGLGGLAVNYLRDTGFRVDIMESTVLLQRDEPYVYCPRASPLSLPLTNCRAVAAPCHFYR